MPYVWSFFLVRNTPYTVPPKDKFVLVVCKESSECMGFLVNSRIGAFIQHHPEMLASQVSLKKADYYFLDHDSYLDCSRLYKFEDVVLESGRGDVTEQTKLEVKEAVAAATTIEQKYQELIALM